ncbi:hypothetical protein MMAS_09220 [Mycobacteroides abscessus subsp. massiliense CCUG 48898 = JCM 15300]|nr:hypothetical protein MMAS_09220 [Mycobacteroides abscessus subsp. massiliense CCUG 48898 = JCM 15300]
MREPNSSRAWPANCHIKAVPRVLAETSLMRSIVRLWLVVSV